MTSGRMFREIYRETTVFSEGLPEPSVAKLVVMTA